MFSIINKKIISNKIQKGIFASGPFFKVKIVLKTKLVFLV